MRDETLKVDLIINVYSTGLPTYEVGTTRRKDKKDRWCYSGQYACVADAVEAALAYWKEEHGY